MPNPILERAFAGEYEAGRVLFAATARPTPEDERWAGLCLLNLGRLPEAQTLLVRGRARGCEAAAVELATVHRLLGELERGRAVLRGLDTSRLGAFDRALAAREEGAALYAAGDLPAAAAALELARAEAEASPHAEALAPGIALMLGVVQAARGRDAQAVHHLDLALSSTSPARRAHALAARASCLTYLGRFREAELDLARAEEATASARLARPVVRYFAAQLARARGLRARALELFAEAAALARGAGEAETEAYAELGACAVATDVERFGAARAHLARARALAEGPKMLAFVALREGALLARAGERDALRVLAGALATFEDLRLEREAGWARLHLAEALVRQDLAATADAALVKATDVRHALGFGAALAVELRALPFVLDRLEALPPGAYAAALLDDWRSLEGAAPLRVELRTLGGPGLLADGRPVQVNAGLARTVETLAYLLLRPARTLEQVQADVFPETSPNRAKNYFHLVRSEVQRAVPGLSVPHDAATRTYSVAHGGVRLDWDAAELKRALGEGGDDGLGRALSLYGGPFLPHAAGDWARAERDELEWSMVRLGLETVEDYYRRGEYGKCLELAGRLLEVAPLNEAINGYLVRATGALKGAVAARQELEHVCERFEGEVGEVPPSLDRLRRDLNDLN